MANIHYHLKSIGPRLQESHRAFVTGQQALNVALQDYHALKRSIPIIEYETERYSALSFKLGLLIGNLKYLIKYYPDGKLPKVFVLVRVCMLRKSVLLDIPAGLKQLMQAADQQNTINLIPSMPFILDRHSYLESNSTQPPSHSQFPATLDKIPPRIEKPMALESLMQNLERTNQRMEEAKIKPVTPESRKALSTSKAGCPGFTPGRTELTPSIHQLNPESEEFVPSNAMSHSYTMLSTAPIAPKENLLVEVGRRKELGSSGNTPASTMKEGAPVIVKSPSTEAYSDLPHMQYLEQPTMDHPQSKILVARSPALASSMQNTNVRVSAPVVRETKLLPHLRVPFQTQATAPTNAVSLITLQHSITRGEDTMEENKRDEEEADPDIAGRALCGAKNGINQKSEEALSTHPGDSLLCKDARMADKEVKESLMKVISQLNGSKPAKSANDEAVIDDQSSMIPVRFIPSKKTTIEFPQPRASPHIRTLQASDSLQNKILQIETNSIASAIFNKRTITEKEKVRNGVNSLKSEIIDERWLDALEAKELSPPRSSSIHSTEKLIDDFEDDHASRQSHHVPTPPGFIPITKLTSVSKAKASYVAWSEKEINNAFMQEALSALPNFSQKYRDKSELQDKSEQYSLYKVR